MSTQHPYRPLYYNLGDEAGVADLAAFWDFDFSEYSLAAMREWLKERHGSLTALNQEWGSEFGRWEQVKPMTTREAMQRSDQNFAAWADFKEWMDVAFARAITAGTEAIHKANPEAVAAIEGPKSPVGAATITLAWPPVSMQWSFMILAITSKWCVRSILG